jgi:sugar phosphate isomerase/epimerase
MISALCLSNSPLSFDAALRQAVDHGFSQVVVAAKADRSLEDYESLAASGLIVAGAMLGNLPPGCALDAEDIANRRRAVTLVQRQITDAGHLGSQFAAVLPGTATAPEARRWFAEACGMLAEHAAGRMIRLCVGHGPRTLLQTPTETAAFLEELSSPAGLLLDAAECPAVGEWIAPLGPRLTCIRLSCPPAASGAWSSEWMAALRQINFRGHVVIDWNCRGVRLE